VLQGVGAESRHLLVSSLVSIFRKLYTDHWQHRQEHILRNILLTLLERPEATTLLDAHRMLSDWRFRKKIAEEVKDPVVKSFWTNEFSKYVYQYKGEALAPIQNKLGAFLTTPLVRNIVGQQQNKVDFREVMDRGRILLVNLAKGRIGEDNSAFLGSLIIAKLQLAAMGRIDVPEEGRRDFYLYVDEFQNFVSGDHFDGILSEARKYRLCLILAHQYLGQLDERLRQAVFGNVGTTIAFPVGPENGESLEKEFSPEFNRHDLVDHDRHHVYLRLAIDGKTSKPFSAVTHPPFFKFSSQGTMGNVIARSRERYSVDR
jgi:hypothetical protein